MADVTLAVGNEAIAEAAIRAGCRYFFGYPITPQNELPEYMSKRLPEVGGVFVQAESEVAAINMVFGASAAGGRVMTSSSSPGVSLKQEGISYMVGAELPCVIVNMMRAGPGLGGIQPAQSDYYQATRGGGHGDYRCLVYAPASVQEMVDLTGLSFQKADEYRNPVIILGDGMLGQMMEPVQFPEMVQGPFPEKPWATTGRKGGPQRVVTSINLQPDELYQHNLKLQAKYDDMKNRETRSEVWGPRDAEIYVVAYGTMARICQAAVGRAREEGIPCGLVRPITLWPFPDKILEGLPCARAFLAVEMSMGQMVDDVRLAVCGKAPVHFFGRAGGVVPKPGEILEEIRKVARSLEGGGLDG
ncbi:MAG: 3-methyl-2-oxobutanoate dehydrogenase subunit VorB [Bacillota bacterium]